MPGQMDQFGRHVAWNPIGWVGAWVLMPCSQRKQETEDNNKKINIAERLKEMKEATRTR